MYVRVSLCLCLHTFFYIFIQTEKIEEKTSSPGVIAKENGVKEVTPTPFGEGGQREPLSTDKHIAETSR